MNTQAPTPSTPSPEERYRSAFPSQASAEPTSKAESTSKAARAYATALDIRKFEIDLYWKRAAYFWVFTGAALAAYLTALTGKDVQNQAQALLLTSCIGLVFATAWYLVNRASKYWQLNWEFHVDLLEDNEAGPLYKTVIEESASFWKLAGPYPFSVSKINQWLSFFVMLLFAALVADTATEHYHLSRNFQWFPTLCLVGTVAAILVMIVFGRVSAFRADVGTTTNDDHFQVE